MHSATYCCLLLGCTLWLTCGQTLSKLWTRMTGTGSNDVANGIVVDTSGNLYIAGYSSGNLDSQTNSGGDDAFLMKYDSSSGTKSWSVLFGTSSDDEGQGVAVDTSGYVYVTGGTDGSLHGQTSAGNYDVFLCKYSPTGVRQWTSLAGSANDDVGYGVTVDSSGSIYVVGRAQGSIGSQTYLGSYDIVLLKYDSSGSRTWTRLLGTTSLDDGRSVAVDMSGNVFITGYTYGSLSLQSYTGNGDMFLAKYSSSGTRQWTRLTGSTSYDDGRGVAVDSSGSIYVAGRAQSTVDGQTNSGSSDILIVKYDTSGTKVWTRLSGTSSTDQGFGVAIDSSAGVYLTGITYGNLDGNSNSGSADIFLTKYNTSGVKQWTQLAGSSSDDYGFGVAVATSGAVFVTGAAGSAVDGQTSSGGYDIVTLSYGLQPTAQPTLQPSTRPTEVPSVVPSQIPSRQPSQLPTFSPTYLPSCQPSTEPSYQPTVQPSTLPTAQPSAMPTAQPTKIPSEQPTRLPTEVPTLEPTAVPSFMPTYEPTLEPSLYPTMLPTTLPTEQPSVIPSNEPSHIPSYMPSQMPSQMPSEIPSQMPSSPPSVEPSFIPSELPTEDPTFEPSTSPTCEPTGDPTEVPSVWPTFTPSIISSEEPTNKPSVRPTDNPSENPSFQPSILPSAAPTQSPSEVPTCDPTYEPSGSPTSIPSHYRTTCPTVAPSESLTTIPSSALVFSPTFTPSYAPTAEPTVSPSSITPSTSPSFSPSCTPTFAPSLFPTSIAVTPTFAPSSSQTSLVASPSSIPSTDPSMQPLTAYPTHVPSNLPSQGPTTAPTLAPSNIPSVAPSWIPSAIPSLSPTWIPSCQPSVIPTMTPSVLATSVPTANPNPQSQVSSAGTTVSQLQQSLLQNLTSSSNVTGMVKTVQSITDDVKVSVSLINVAGKNSSSNATIFLPPISIPDSQTTVGVAVPGGVGSNGGTVVVSVTEYNKDLFKNQSNNSTATNSNGLPTVIQSDIVGVKVDIVSKNGSTSTQLPAFVANMSVDEALSSLSAPIFRHNCTVGKKESVSFLCPDSNMLYNLTCSGKSAAIVKRQCPVPQTVCNVLNLQTATVISSDYCQAVKASTGFVVCYCGLSRQNSSSSTASSIIASGGTVNVAVMTQYVTGDFSTTVANAASISSGSFAAKSSAVFIAFGCIWAVGIVAMGVHYSSMNVVAVVGLSKVNPTMKNGPKMQQQPSGKYGSTKVQERLYGYLVSVVPSIYQQNTWWRRLWEQFCLHHDYVRVCVSLMSSHHHHGHQSGRFVNNVTLAMEAKHRKKTILEVAQILTLTMVFCFVLAVLYDLQYPPNDGSCEQFHNQANCLNRRSLLDPALSFCRWDPPPAEDSAGELVESRNNRILQRLSLDESEDDTITSCFFNGSETSVLATVVSIAITSCLSIPAKTALTALFGIIGARTLKDVHNLLQASKVRNSTHASSRSKGRATSSRRVGIITTEDWYIREQYQLEQQADERKRANALNSHGSNDDEDEDDEDDNLQMDEEVALPTNVKGGQRGRPVVSGGQGAGRGVRSSTAGTTASMTTATSPRFAISGTSIHQRLTATAGFSMKWPVNAEMSMKAASRFFRPDDAARNSDEDISAVRSLIVPSSVRVARERFLDACEDVTSVASSSPQRRITPIPTSNSFRASIPTLAEALAEGEAERLRHELRHASDLEYGMVLLQTLLGDRLGGVNTATGRFFHFVLQKDFEHETSAVPRRSQWLCILFVICINLGAMYYLALKGVQRGLAWQRTFLKVCLLEWLIDVCIQETMEVLWVDVCLPSFIQNEVTMGLNYLRRLTNSFEAELRGEPGSSQAQLQPLSGSETLNRQISLKGPASLLTSTGGGSTHSLFGAIPQVSHSNSIVSQANSPIRQQLDSTHRGAAFVLARHKPRLPESAFALHCVDFAHLRTRQSSQRQLLSPQQQQQQQHYNVSDVNEVDHFFESSTTPVCLLRALVQIPAEIQGVLAQLLATAVVGAAILLWYVLQTVLPLSTGMLLQAVFIIVFIILACAMVYVALKQPSPVLNNIATNPAVVSSVAATTPADQLDEMVWSTLSPQKVKPIHASNSVSGANKHDSQGLDLEAAASPYLQSGSVESLTYEHKADDDNHKDDCDLNEPCSLHRLEVDTARDIETPIDLNDGDGCVGGGIVNQPFRTSTDHCSSNLGQPPKKQSFDTNIGSDLLSNVQFVAVSAPSTNAAVDGSQMLQTSASLPSALSVTIDNNEKSSLALLVPSEGCKGIHEESLTPVPSMQSPPALVTTFSSHSQEAGAISPFTSPKKGNEADCTLPQQKIDPLDHPDHHRKSNSETNKALGIDRNEAEKNQIMDTTSTGNEQHVMRMLAETLPPKEGMASSAVEPTAIEAHDANKKEVISTPDRSPRRSLVSSPRVSSPSHHKHHRPYSASSTSSRVPPSPSHAKTPQLQSHEAIAVKQHTLQPQPQPQQPQQPLALIDNSIASIRARLQTNTWTSSSPSSSMRLSAKNGSVAVVAGGGASAAALMSTLPSKKHARGGPVAGTSLTSSATPGLNAIVSSDASGVGIVDVAGGSLNGSAVAAPTTVHVDAVANSNRTANGTHSHASGNSDDAHAIAVAEDEEVDVAAEDVVEEEDDLLS